MAEFIAKKVILKDINNNYLIPYTEGSGAGIPVGTIFAHTATANFVPENSLPCDGTEYSKTQFDKLYTDWLVTKKLETCTYEEYQQEITTTGECLKWGIDTVNLKFKVPTKLNNYVSSYNLSNIKSKEIRYFVIVATKAIKQSEMDWSAWASSLRGKTNVDADNLSKAGKELLSSLGKPSNKFTDLVAGANGTKYVAPSNGYFSAGFSVLDNGGWAAFTVLDNNMSTSEAGATRGGGFGLFMPVLKGQTIQVGYGVTRLDWIRFIYAEGSK